MGDGSSSFSRVVDGCLAASWLSVEEDDTDCLLHELGLVDSDEVSTDSSESSS